MNPVALTACLDELEKIAAHMKEAGSIHIPQALQGLVRPEMGPRAFREILEGYRTGAMNEVLSEEDQKRHGG